MRPLLVLVFVGFAVTACGDEREDEEHGVGGSASGARGGSGPRGGSNATGGSGATATGGSGATTGGSGSCVEDLGCELEPPPSTGDIHQDCVNRINQFRAECACLPPLARWTEGEACADRMAEYDSTRSAHAGFNANICQGGSAQNECPGWNSVTQVIDGCLQSMWDEGPPPTQTCNNACFQMYGHFINMTDDNYGRVACGFFTAPDGEVWAVQNFTD